MNIHEWNQKLYPIEESKRLLPRELLAQWFWDNFQIRSAPKFKEECWYHIPIAWGDEVTSLINNIHTLYQDKVRFIQIKEKMAWLTVYFRADTKEIEGAVYNIIKTTQETLRKKGLHP